MTIDLRSCGGDDAKRWRKDHKFSATDKQYGRKRSFRELRKRFER